MLHTENGLKYLTLGDGPEAVICHPSLGLGRFLYYRIIPPLSRHYQVISYDPRGVGDNARLEPGLDAWVNDVGDLLTIADRPCHLLGVSLGTWVMSRAALRWPDRVGRVVLMGTTPGFSGGLELVEARRQELLNQSMAEFALGYAESTLTPAADPEVKQQLAADLAMQEVESYLKAMREIYLVDNSEIFSQLEAETLLIVGTKDNRTTPEMADRAARLIPRGTVCAVPDAGHLALLDQPGRVQTLVETFLATGGIGD